ncbi:winged helix-turn-helix domain-containing protein [Aeromonas piscicola]|uniref:winged helix-turn-helix domain-containing protein n=1 Tax=Aeromonas piscicola TaxID=600645 RepID=UPI0021F83CC1|nr:helix-turn-helix domain-containing protein [Aeromonas piscicola]MCW0507636.1 helix-turn-helix domain-containing protein [Aeromonas piscicola]
MSCYIIHGKIKFDTDLYCLIGEDGVEVGLSQMEVKVLSILCEYPRQTVSRQYLFDNAWANDTGTDGHLNRVILLLRRKFDSLGFLDVIKTVSKVGYVIGDVDNFLNKSVEMDIKNTDDSTPPTTSLTNNLSTPLGKDNSDSKNISPLYRAQKKHIFNRYLATVAIVFTIGAIVYFKIQSNEKNEIKTLNSTRSQLQMFYSVGNISMYSSIALNKDDKNELIKLASAKLRGDKGMFYIGISNKSISFLKMNNEQKSESKLIYIRGNKDITDELNCVIYQSKKYESNSILATEKVKKHSITKRFNSLVSPLCPIEPEQLMNLNISITISSDATENDREDIDDFFYISMIGEENASQMFSFTASGYVNKIIEDDIVYDRWNAKTKSINHLNEDFNENPAVIKLVDSIANKNSIFITKKITEGVYTSDLLDGVIFSTK